MAGGWRKNTYLWYCASAYLAFLLTVIGIASSAWTERYVGSESAQYGLLSYCSYFYLNTASFSNSTRICGSYGFGDRPVWFDVSRVFSLLSVVFLFTTVPVSCYLHFEDEKREDVTLLTVYGVVVAIVGLIGAIVFGASENLGQGQIAWGFIIFLIGHVIVFVVFLTICISFHVCPRRKSAKIKPYYNHQKPA